jgi:hypothetical protein
MAIHEHAGKPVGTKKLNISGTKKLNIREHQ